MCPQMSNSGTVSGFRMKDRKTVREKSYLSPVLWHIETHGVVTPSDFLTQEERSKLNGPVVTYKLPESVKEEPEPMEKQETQGPPALTRENMEALIKEGRSTSQLAKLFGVSRGTINNKKRLWGLVRTTARSTTPVSTIPEASTGGHIQIDVTDVLEASAAEQLLKNIANFVLANGGRYELTLRVSKAK